MVGNQEDEKKLPLWTRSFTILTVGSVVSKLGSALSGFAIGLLVLDMSGSVFLYALYMCMYSLASALVPILAGPYLDKFSRRKTIYTLDFISSAIYFIFAVVMFSGHFNYFVLLVASVMLGVINSIYNVAYDSLYPMLITKGNYTKAYSIASVLETLTMVMVPISALMYNVFGMVPLFLLDAISFLIAAIFETKIRVKEEYIEKRQEPFTSNQYKKDFIEGIQYLKQEKGLAFITLYFMVTMCASGAYNTLVLPYFKGNFPSGEYLFILVTGCGVIGRTIGGMIHYKFKYPVNKKFAIAIFVYLTISILEGSYLYFTVPIMMIFCFITGILGVTSYNIRISATQSYVPNERKGRFNGIFIMSTTIGVFIGQLTSGALAEVFSERYVLSGFMIVNFVAALLLVYHNRNDIKPIYNRHA